MLMGIFKLLTVNSEYQLGIPLHIPDFKLTSACNELLMQIYDFHLYKALYCTEHNILVMVPYQPRNLFLPLFIPLIRFQASVIFITYLLSISTTISVFYH